MARTKEQNTAIYVARSARAQAQGFVSFWQKRISGGAQARLEQAVPVRPRGQAAPPAPGPPPAKPPRIRDYVQENIRRQEIARGLGYGGSGERQRTYREIRESLYNYVGPDGWALTPEEFKIADGLLKQCADELVYWRSKEQEPHLTPEFKRHVESVLGEFMNFREIWNQMKAIYLGRKM